MENLIIQSLKESFRLKEIFDDSKISNIIPENIQTEIWQKFLFITTVSGLGGLTRASIDIMRESEYLYDLMQNIAKEVMAVAKAKGMSIYRKRTMSGLLM